MKSLVTLCAILFAAAASLAQNALVIEGAVVIDGVASRPQKNVVIVIENGRITGFGKRSTVVIPPGARRLDMRGKFIIPGLIDGQVRAASERDLLQMLAWGVTSASCTFSSTQEALDAERRTASDTSRAPQIYATAPIFTARGGWTSAEGSDTLVGRFPETPEDARAQVRRLKATGIRRVRIVYDAMAWARDTLPPLPRMSREVMEAVIDEAAKQKLFTSVQSPMLADAREALNAGAMSLAPGILDEYLDASTIETMLSRNDYIVPALSSMEFLAEGEGYMKRVLADKRFRAALGPALVKEYSSPAYARRLRAELPSGAFVRSHLPTFRDNLSTLVKNYVLIVMGSDLPALPGIAAHLELEAMVRAGLTTYHAIIAATTFGGQYLGAATKVGTIEIGRTADLLVLNADPAEDIRNTRNINIIIKHGRIFHPKELLKEARR